MLKKLLISGLFAGFGAGLIAALLQITLVVPTLMEGERFEHGELTHFGAYVEPVAAEDDAHGAHDDGEVSLWTRHSLTVMAELSKYIGFGLMLVAGFALAARHGVKTNARTGMIWGLCGFLAVSLLPSFGHPPVLPGSLTADLYDRQIWWAWSLVASVSGLALIAFGKNWVFWAAGIVLLALPHIVGVPTLEGYAGTAPPELAALLVGQSLVIAAVGWVILGLFAGYFWARENAS